MCNFPPREYFEGDPGRAGPGHGPVLIAGRTRRPPKEHVPAMGMYEQIARNKRRTFVMLAVFVLLIAAVAVALGILFQAGVAIVPIAIVIAIAMAWTSYFASDRIALAASRAKPADGPEYRALPQPRRGAVHRRRPAEAAPVRGRRPGAERVRHRPQPEARRDRGHDRPAREDEPGRARGRARPRAQPRAQLRHPRHRRSRSPRSARSRSWPTSACGSCGSAAVRTGATTTTAAARADPRDPRAGAADPRAVRRAAHAVRDEPPARAAGRRVRASSSRATRRA